MVTLNVVRYNARYYLNHSTEPRTDDSDEMYASDEAEFDHIPQDSRRYKSGQTPYCWKISLLTCI